MIAMPSSAQLGGPQYPQYPQYPSAEQQASHNPQQPQLVPVPVLQQPPPFVRFPFFPTAPWYSSNPDVGYQVRYYIKSVSSSESDWAVGSELQRTMQFDLPVRVVAINGALASTAEDPVASGITEQNMNLLWKVRFDYSSNDKLTTSPVIAAGVVGTSRNPGEIGGHGYNIDQGASIQIGITPLVDNAQIDIVFHCLEMRAPRNFSLG